MRRKKSEPQVDETVMQYLYWTEDDRKWDRIRRLKAGGITEITEQDRMLQRSWAGLEHVAYRAPDVSRPYVWTPKLQRDRLDQENLRRMIVDAKVDGDLELAKSLEVAYNRLANKVQGRVDRMGGYRHANKRSKVTNKHIAEPFDECAILNDKEIWPDEDE